MGIGTPNPTPHELHSRQWLRSSYSGGNDNCIEISTVQGRITLRDSKRPDLSHTSFSAAAWRAFVSAAAADTLN
ncbi:DUF397 domain-containing protein [Streptomyces sp. NPDC059590]|uniref:DUF397 domain-containing protein n=1 Tax=Streptomyces sp. NPDC059590 TaxID=3346877 RepID=UPI0036A87C00